MNRLLDEFCMHLAPHFRYCHLQDLEVEIIPRLENFVCRLQEPDEDDVNLLQAPVGGLPLLQTSQSCRCPQMRLRFCCMVKKKAEVCRYHGNKECPCSSVS